MALLITDPMWLDFVLAVTLAVGLLVISSLLLGYSIASVNSGKVKTAVGIVLLAVMFSFIGFFILFIGVWLTGLYHATFG